MREILWFLDWDVITYPPMWIMMAILVAIVIVPNIVDAIKNEKETKNKE